MTKKEQKVLKALPLALAALIVYPAQANSILSLRYPLGLPLRSNSSVSFSMGGTSTGFLTSENVLLRNPANLGAINKTVFSSLSIVDGLYVRDAAAGASTAHVNFVPRQLSFGFPLGKAGTLGFAFEKRSDATMRYTRTYSDPALADITTKYARDGGMSAWQVGMGRMIGSFLYAGASYERIYVTMESSVISQGARTSVDSTHLAFGGNGVKAGVIIPIKKLTIGLSGEYFLKGTATTTQMRVAIDTTVGPKKERVDIYLPPSLSVGVSYRFNKSITAGADADLVLHNYFSKPDALLGARSRDIGAGMSVGAELVPAPDELTPRYWETMHYRLGGRYTQMPVDGSSETALTIGTGFPLPGGGGLLDIGLELGRRFDSNYKNITEDIVRLAIGINGGRKWAKSTQGTSY